MKDVPEEINMKLSKIDASLHVLSCIVDAAPSKLLWECLRYYFTTNSVVAANRELVAKRPKTTDSSLLRSFKDLLSSVGNLNTSEEYNPD